MSDDLEMESTQLRSGVAGGLEYAGNQLFELRSNALSAIAGVGSPEGSDEGGQEIARNLRPALADLEQVLDSQADALRQYADIAGQIADLIDNTEDESARGFGS